MRSVAYQGSAPGGYETKDCTPKSSTSNTDRCDRALDLKAGTYSQEASGAWRSF